MHVLNINKLRGVTTTRMFLLATEAQTPYLVQLLINADSAAIRTASNSLMTAADVTAQLCRYLATAASGCSSRRSTWSVTMTTPRLSWHRRQRRQC